MFRRDKKGRFGLYARQTLVLTRMAGGHRVEGMRQDFRERREGTNGKLEDAVFRFGITQQRRGRA